MSVAPERKTSINGAGTSNGTLPTPRSRWWRPLLAAVVAVAVALAARKRPPADKTPTAPRLPPWPVFRVGVAVHSFFSFLAHKTKPPRAVAMDVASGYWQSAIAYGLAKHAVFDAFAPGERATCDEIAKRAQLHAPFLCRYMAAGAELGLLSRRDNDETSSSYAPTSAGDLLRKDAATSLRPILLMMNEESREAWYAAAATSLKTGTPGFVERYGKPFFDWHARHADKAAQFDEAMTAIGRSGIHALLEDYAIETSDDGNVNATTKHSTVVCDVGGGRGSLVRAIADRYPRARFVLFDLPETARRAKAYLADDGGFFDADRFSVRGGSFFDPLPRDLSACDVVFLKYVIHDWPDDDATRILANVKRAVTKPGAKLALVENVLETGPAVFRRAKQMQDINMLSIMGTAKERTLADYERLLHRAGIETNQNNLRHVPLRFPSSVIEVTLLRS